jgi:hypothetical protein
MAETMNQKDEVMQTFALRIVAFENLVPSILAP